MQLLRRGLCAAVILVTPLFSAHAESELERHVSFLPSPVISGYGRTLGGNHITYRSINPAARQALIVRALDGTQSITWETSPVPAGSSDSVSLAWIAAMSGSKGEHRFRLSVNDSAACEFTSASDPSRMTFAVRGAHDEQLSFVALQADRFGDLFGYMFLVLPRSAIREGEPVKLCVTGDSANSTAWFMVFEHGLVDTVRIRPLPALLSTRNGARQPVQVTIEHYGPPTTAQLHVDGGTGNQTLLTWGVNELSADLVPVTATTSRNIKVTVGNTVMVDRRVLLSPVRTRTFCLLPHSHTDIGYSDYQAVVERHHQEYIDSALAISRRTDGYPAGAKFRWNIEVLWPLETYLSTCDPERRAALREAVAKGNIGLNGLYANVLLGLCRPEELMRTTEYARRIGAEFRVPVRSAMITDIPSYGWGIVSALASSGIRYFSSGPNYMPTLPDGGDRIGATLKIWGDKPVYWVSQSGRDTVLFWMAGRGYSWFHGLNMGDLDRADPTNIFAYAEELTERGYPYDLVQVRYTIGGDNGPPDPRLSDAVRRWNERYLTPRFAIMTTDELFSTFEAEHGRRLPVVKGDLTPHWEDGAASSPAELALNRRSGEQLMVADSLAAIFKQPLDPESLAVAWRDVTLFNEHTWGAASSVSDPDSPDSKAQWEYKRAFAVSGARRATALLATVTGTFPPRNTSMLDVVNPSSWARSGLIEIPDTLTIAGDRVMAVPGGPLVSQRLSSGGLAVWINTIPPHGRIRLRFSEGTPFQPAVPVAISKTECSNGTSHITWDATAGDITAWDWRGVSLIDTTHGARLHQYLYVPSRDPKQALVPSGGTARIVEKGPLVATVVFTPQVPGCVTLDRSVTMVAGSDILILRNRIVREPVRTKESVHIGFPFALAGGTVRIDGGSTVVRPGVDQLNGSNYDFFSAARWADVSIDARGVTLAVPDAPFVEVGAMTNETLNRGGTRSWRASPPTGTTLYSYVMNNYWHTNYKADAAGECIMNYRLRPHGPFDPTKAGRFATEVGQPLVLMPAE